MISDHRAPSSKAEQRADTGRSYCCEGYTRLFRSLAAPGLVLFGGSTIAVAPSIDMMER